ncbi:hypothetical protein R1sor_014223 [Riccia sorocarpa]|uniref:Uncharacterized protein n=1 Tax=Riccia sorocarpa TaxID=122646 RepID=A0ABD3HBN6_9MARC
MATGSFCFRSSGGLQYFASHSGRSPSPFLRLFTAPMTVLPYQFLHKTVLGPSVEPAVRARSMTTREHCQKLPEEVGNLVDRAMGGSSALLIPMLLEKYTGFECLGSLVDVGGGTHVLAKGVRVTVLLPSISEYKVDKEQPPDFTVKGFQSSTRAAFAPMSLDLSLD